MCLKLAFCAYVSQKSQFFIEEPWVVTVVGTWGDDDNPFVIDSGGGPGTNTSLPYTKHDKITNVCIYS